MSLLSIAATASAMVFSSDGLAGWASFLDPWRRSPRRPYFLCLCKESRQRKHTPAVRPLLRSGFAVPARIFVRGILPRTKTAHILVRRPCGVLPAVTAGPQGPQEPLSLVLTLSGSP